MREVNHANYDAELLGCDKNRQATFAGCSVKTPLLGVRAQHSLRIAFSITGSQVWNRTSECDKKRG
jgi:hypothetical protein